MINLNDIISDFMNGTSAPVIKLSNGLFVTCYNIIPNQDGQKHAVDLYFGDGNTSISIVGYPTEWEYNYRDYKWYMNISFNPVGPGVIPGPGGGGGVR